MAAVLGLPSDAVEEACMVASVEGVVEVANYNSPEQTVISGEDDAVRRAMEESTLRGASRVIELQVSAPFHCRLMRGMAEQFKHELDRAEISDPRVPVVANVTADYEQTAAQVRENLVSQLASPVRWTESVQRLIADGHDRFIEAGPGKVLTRLMKAIDPEITAVATNDPTGIQKAVEAIEGA
jgi:[acyl-carrier-protein] S-malonyltransferase